MTCYVYIITLTEYGYIKIGISRDPLNRFSHIQSCNPFELELSYVLHTQDAPKVERKMHQMYSQYNIRGEWFSVSPDAACDTALSLGCKVVPLSKQVGGGVGRMAYWSRSNVATHKVREHLAINPDDRRLTVRDLAKKIGVGKSTVSRVLNE